MEHKMPSIGNFASMLRHKATAYDKTISMVLKPKLHGTNASIYITDDKFECRSKNRILTAESDHMDFAKTMASLYEEWKEYQEEVWCGQDIVVYGEWAGPGVQKSDAVSMIPRKTFFVFAVYALNEGVFAKNLDVFDYFNDNRVYEITPIRNEVINLNEAVPIQWFVDIVNDEVEKFEELDHYIKAAFDVEGCGEGIVGTPVWSPSHTHWAEHTFKAKTEAHRVQKSKAPATAHEPLPQEAFEVATMFVTEPRVRQAMSELGIDTPTMQDTPNILKWMGTDIHKESVDVLSEMDIEWSKVVKIINTRIVQMWKGFVNGDLKA